MDAPKILISEEEIRLKIKELGNTISKDYYGESILLVGILKGSAIFLSDLAREIDADIDFDFVSISSYGGEMSSSGVVRTLKDLDINVRDKNVLIVEDIVDTGWTLRMSYLIDNIKSRSCKSVKVCTLLDKPSRRKINIGIDYCGFVIEDLFVVGYGLDYNGKYRNLKYIGILEE